MINQIKRFMRKNKFCAGLVYAAYRICCPFYSFLFLCCRVFPVKENKIVCCNMKGKRYGDNPKYIVDEIICQGLDYEIVWLLKGSRDPNMPAEIVCAPYNPFSIAYHLSTAKIWIDTNMKAIGTLKRKNQFYIQTWHGSYGIKKIAYDVKNGQELMEVRPYDYNSKIEDVILSNSRMTTSIYRRAFHYNGFFLECGSPRNDILFEKTGKYRKKIDLCFDIEKEKKIILYAPTFRNDYATTCMQMNFKKVQQAFEERFGGKWVVLIRLHPNNLKDAEKFIQYSENIINATEYHVMQELLVASDVLITDYSSCMFDFVTTGKPCFLYATDIEKYKGERDFYFDIMSLPFPVAQNNTELVQNITEFDEVLYGKKLKKLFDQVGLCDHGTACRQVVDYIKGLK